MKSKRAVQSWTGIVALFAAVSLHAADLNQVHLNVTDSVKAAEWYAKYMGGKASTMGTRAMVNFGKVNMLSYQIDAPFPGSVGSTIDHLGFSFPDLDAKMKEFQEAGIKILTQPRTIGTLKIAFIEDPWGTKIEVMQDPELLGFHHVHLAAANPADMLKWFLDALGGEEVKLAGSIPAVKYGDIFLLALKASEEPAPTIGRSVDHIGFGIKDMDALAKQLKEKGARFTTEPRSLGSGKVAFFEGPSGIRIELIQSGQ